MDISEIEENLLSIGEPKLHGEMCKSLCGVYVKVLAIFPDIEAARPRSASGIQALCALHIALDKTKSVLQHCAECSKLYLAITGDSVVLKFEKARCALDDGLNRVEDIVPQAIGVQISEILVELGRINFSLDPAEKQIGDEIIALLQQGNSFHNTSNDTNELELFHQAAFKLGITSSRAALRERRALKKHIERARAEEDKRKESIVAYLLHLIRKYSKLFRNEYSDDNDSQGSTPCSPTVHGSLGCAFDRQLSKLSSFNFKPNLRRSEQMTVPPEELRCPISLQLMYDPVIIASGQTYERVCIEKWFSDGHNTCPKTQQQLPHLSLTPNYCVKGLVASWCEQNGIPVPDGPPESLDLNYWRLVLSESDSANSKSLLESVGSCKFKGVKVVPLNDSGIIEEAEGNEEDEEAVSVSPQEDCKEVRAFQKYEGFLRILEGGDSDLMKKCKVVADHSIKDGDPNDGIEVHEGSLQKTKHHEEEDAIFDDTAGSDTDNQDENITEDIETLSKEELGRRVASRWTGEKTDQNEDFDASIDKNHEFPDETPNEINDDENSYGSDDDEHKYDEDDDSGDLADDIGEDHHYDSSSSHRPESDDELDMSDMITGSSGSSWLDKLQKKVKSFFQAVNVFQKPVNITEAAHIRKDYDESSAKLSKLQSKISKLEHKLKQDFGPEKEFYSFYGQCFETKQNKYVYKVCPFKEASQVEGHSTTRLGSWEKFEDSYRAMQFLNGDKCWNGPDRSIKVKLRCGLKNELADVDEPSRCEYLALLSTPAMCLDSRLKELQDKLESLNKDQPEAHDEL